MGKTKSFRVNIYLREARLARGWSQQEVADRIGTTPNTVSRWELGVSIPGAYLQSKLCKLYKKSLAELGLLSDEQYDEQEASREKESVLVSDPISAQPLWNIPYRRNLLFTGRENFLQHLYATVQSGKVAGVTQAQTLSGLGGIGKTQVALEFAYRFSHDYQAILWVRADTPEIFRADAAALGAILHLPDPAEQDQQRVITAVRRWLATHNSWLLVFDNVLDLRTVSDFLPQTYQGHILLTTRMQAMGTLAHLLEIEAMSPEEGALLLLRRAKLIARDASLDAALEQHKILAMKLSEIVGGLPLALDQAGAYLEETGSDLSHYLELYQTRQAALLNRRGEGDNDHPDSVVTTFSLCIEQVEQLNPAAADLLRYCAFLHPDAIPISLIHDGCAELGPLLQPLAADKLALDEAIRLLRQFSLLRRNPESQTLTVHRLVQAVLKARMDERTQRLWVERVVRSIYCAVPYTGGVIQWAFDPLSLSQVQNCTRLIEQWDVASIEAGRLVTQLGSFFFKWGPYQQAEKPYQMAYDIFKRVLGDEHLEVTTSLNNLAALSYVQGKYPQAESLYRQALAMRERLGGKVDDELAHNLNGLAILYSSQGRYLEAEPLYRQALAVAEHVFSSGHPEVAHVRNGLAVLYGRQGRYEEAEPLLLQTLQDQETALGPEHPEMGVTLNNLAKLYMLQGRYEEAEPLYRRALSVYEKTYGSEYSLIATTLGNMAQFYARQRRYRQAEAHYQQALSMREKTLGPEHPRTTQLRDEFAQFYTEQGRCMEAERLHQRTLHIHEQRGSEEIKAANQMRDQHLLESFFAAFCEFHPQAWCCASDLWSAYQQWVQETQVRFPLSRRAFARELRIRQCLPGHTKTSRIWRGVTVRSHAPEDDG